MIHFFELLQRIFQDPCLECIPCKKVLARSLFTCKIFEGMFFDCIFLNQGSNFRQLSRELIFFQPSLNDSSQITPPSVYPEQLSDVRKLRREPSQIRPAPSLPQKVGFHEPSSPIECAGKLGKKHKRSPFYTCIDCDDADDETEYGGPLPGNDFNEPGNDRPRQPRSKKPKNWLNKMKDVFVYESSGTETDISDDDNPDGDSRAPFKGKKGGKKLFDGCLGRSDPGESVDEDKGTLCIVVKNGFPKDYKK